MFCPKCGDPIEQNEIYCNKCGNYLGTPLTNNEPIINSQQNLNNSANYLSNNNFAKNIDRTKLAKKILIGVGIGMSFLVVFAIILFNGSNKYYFSNNSYTGSNEKSSDSSATKKSKYSTAIIIDNTYSGIDVSTKSSANELISKDSVDQKEKCPIEIQEIENNIINKYGIVAVNLCEINIDFAKEIEKVYEKIYKEYPSVRGYLTNFTITNASISEGYIAAFAPSFVFATSDSQTSYPWVIKTQILLNSTYFLNQERLESSVKAGSSSGHFPANATKYSPVAHELGHYLSFIAMMRSINLDSILILDNKNSNKYYTVYDDFVKGDFSLKMIKEAYENYKNQIGTTETIDEWRANISQYAVAKNNRGEYIYDETIAEAFHDVYLNGEKANNVSKFVVAVLKKKLGD